MFFSKKNDPEECLDISNVQIIANTKTGYRKMDSEKCYFSRPVMYLDFCHCNNSNYSFLRNFTRDKTILLYKDNGFLKLGNDEISREYIEELQKLSETTDDNYYYIELF